MKKMYSLAIMTLLSVYGFGQVNGFSNLVIENTTEGTDVVFDVTYEYDEANPTFKNVKFYYTINANHTDAEWTQAVEDDDNDIQSDVFDTRKSVEIDVKADDNKYSFSIPSSELVTDDIIRFYFRGYTKNTDGDKEKEYFSPDKGSEFDHDVYSQWSSISAYSTLSNELFEKATTSLYPIPAGDNLTFKSEINKIGTFKIFNMSGKLMKSTKSNLTNSILDISSLNSGNYILNVSVDNNSKSYNFTK